MPDNFACKPIAPMKLQSSPASSVTAFNVVFADAALYISSRFMYHAVGGDRSFFSLCRGIDQLHILYRDDWDNTGIWMGPATVQCTSYAARCFSQCTGSCRSRMPCCIYDTETEQVVFLPFSNFLIMCQLAYFGYLVQSAVISSAHHNNCANRRSIYSEPRKTVPWKAPLQ